MMTYQWQENKQGNYMEGKLMVNKASRREILSIKIMISFLMAGNTFK